MKRKKASTTGTSRTSERFATWSSWSHWMKTRNQIRFTPFLKMAFCRCSILRRRSLSGRRSLQDQQQQKEMMKNTTSDICQETYWFIRRKELCLWTRLDTPISKSILVISLEMRWRMLRRMARKHLLLHSLIMRDKFILALHLAIELPFTEQQSTSLPSPSTPRSMLQHLLTHLSSSLTPQTRTSPSLPGTPPAPPHNYDLTSWTSPVRPANSLLQSHLSNL